MVTRGCRCHTPYTDGEALVNPNLEMGRHKSPRQILAKLIFGWCISASLVVTCTQNHILSVVVCAQAMAYFEQLKESRDAWEVCTEALAKGIYRWGSPWLHFLLPSWHILINLFALSVMTMSSSSAFKFWSIKSNLGEDVDLSWMNCDYVRVSPNTNMCVYFRHASLSAAQQQLIRETLMKWLQCQVPSQTHWNPHARLFLLILNKFGWGQNVNLLPNIAQVLRWTANRRRSLHLLVVWYKGMGALNLKFLKINSYLLQSQGYCGPTLLGPGSLAYCHWSLQTQLSK